MSTYTANIVWERGDQPFSDGKYSRKHLISFDGGAHLAGSSAPSAVPVPMSAPEAADPEEMVCAALGSCHMMFFLAFAKKAGLIVDRYEDDPLAVLEKDGRGIVCITKITLQPLVVWSGATQPDAALVAKLHHDAHVACYVGNSLRANIEIAPR